MPFARTHSVALQGIDGAVVEIEADISAQLPAFILIGLPDAALGEARDRVRAAAVNAGIPLTTRKLTINLSPASLPKHGAGFDLAIAMAAYAADGQVSAPSVARVAHLGELGLDGRVRPVAGVLPAVLAAARAGFETVVVPAGNAAEARLVPDVHVVGVASLREAAIFHGAELEPVEVEPLMPVALSQPVEQVGDLSEVIGNPDAVEAMQIAAAGGHHVYLLGPPGAGKTMLASRLPGLLPDLTAAEGIEVSSIRSLVGMPVGADLVRRPPLEAPHHTASPAAIVGGGSGLIRPGAAARAAHGVLFLDDTTRQYLHTAKSSGLIHPDLAISTRQRDLRSSCRPVDLQSQTPRGAIRSELVEVSSYRHSTSRRPIMGHGIISRGDIAPTTIDGIRLDRIYDEYQAVLSEWNKRRDLFTRLFTFDTLAPGDAILADSDRLAFEEQSQFGVAKAGSITPTPFLVGYPHKFYDVATRFTRAFLRDSRREQVDAIHAAALESHNEALFTLALRALMIKTTVSTRASNENGTPVFDLYDGETDSKPPAFAGKTFAAGHQHYVTTGSTDYDGADLAMMINHITEHGYGVGAGEKIVIFLHPNQADTARSFRVADGDPFDFIPSSSAAPYLTDLRIAGQQPAAEFEGMEVFGSYGKALLVENVLVPSGYVIALATSGANSRRNPLAFRQHETASERGLRLIPGPYSFPLQESFYQFGAGFGVRNRGAAVVMQITASSTYTNPTIAVRV